MNSYFELIEPLFSTVEYGDTAEKYAESIRSLPLSSVILFAAHVCMEEVRNGGFLQLFWNSAGLLLPEAIEGLVAVNLPQAAKILEDAARPLGSPYPRSREDRWDALLLASGKSEDDLMRIFAKYAGSTSSAVDQAKAMYQAFSEATANLNFNSLERAFWTLCDTENGGFSKNATRYAQSPDALQ